MRRSRPSTEVCESLGRNNRPCFWVLSPGVTGGLAAPLVAAGAGAVLGAGGAAALGSAAGIAIMASLFGAAGAGLTGEMASRDVEECFLQKQDKTFKHFPSAAW